MTRFNQPSPGTKTTNLAGGEAYAEQPELEFVSTLLTSFVSDQYYRSADQTIERIKELLKSIDPQFAAKAAIYARNEFGMRSITHVVAGELGIKAKGDPWKRRFYNRVVHRVDDITEILSYYLHAYGKPIPNSMKRGLADSFSKFDEYQLAKYRAEKKTISLVDAVNLLRPKPTDKNAEALAKLVKGELKSTGTWESELTKAGQEAESEEDKQERKRESWEKLVRERKIGYFALLRNLRNIIQDAPEVTDEAVAMLTDEHLIRRSLVLPFRFQTALEELSKVGLAQSIKILIGLNKALELSLANVPRLEGQTLVVLDESGSMGGRPIEIGALFAAVLLKTNNALLMLFSDDARYKIINPLDSIGSIVKDIKSDLRMAGTDFHSIFTTANQPYDRFIILSDMQGWRGDDYYGYGAPTKALAEYRSKTGADPIIYSFNLQDYGTIMFPERNVYAIAGFSEKIFDVMKVLEQDKRALINKINEVEI